MVYSEPGSHRRPLITFKGKRTGLTLFSCPKCNDNPFIVMNSDPGSTDFTCKKCGFKFEVVIEYEWESRAKEIMEENEKQKAEVKEIKVVKKDDALQRLFKRARVGG